MSQIGTLVGGAGNPTLINLDYVPSYLQIGEIDADLPIDQFSIEIASVPTINVNNQAAIQAFSKYLNECLLGADVKISQVLKICGGNLSGVKCSIRLRNAGATTPNIYAFSTRNGSPAEAVKFGQEVVQAQSRQRFAGFTALFFDATNLDRAEVQFSSGYTDTLSDVELRSLFAMGNQCDANGQLAGLTVIDNKDRLINSVTLYATNGGNVVVYPFRL